MRIVHLIFSFKTGGAETMLIDIINEQIKSEKISLIIINKYFDRKLLKLIDHNVKVFLVGREEKSKNLFPLLKLNLLLLNLKPDVIHCHNYKAINMLVPFLHKKTVLTIHDTGFPTNNFFKYAKLFAISKSVARDVKNRCNLEPTVIYNGIRINTVKKKNKFKKKKTFKVVQISRLDTYKKGQHLAIEAIRKLRNDYNIFNIHLDFIGEGNSRDYLTNLVTKYRLQNQISFLGLKDRKFIYSNVKEYDLLIQPSLYEGFGLSIVEGMAANVPVLVSNIDGPMEIIDNGKYGYWFENGNEIDLAMKIKYIMNNYFIDDKIYVYICDNFEIYNTSKKYINRYLK